MRLHHSKKPSVNFPFAPARFPFFYGWVITAATTLGTIMSIPGQTMGVSVFTDHLLAVLTLSRIELSEAYMFGTIASSCVLPFAGRLYDRTGARFMVVLASLGLGASLLYLSCCDAVARAVGSLISVSAEGVAPVELAVIAIGFFLVRFWGQGVLTMISRVMLAKWFQARRGLAMGISGVVVSAAFSTAPFTLAVLIDAWGWRGAWVVLAGLLWVGMATLGWIFYRDTPEECGLSVDGSAASAAKPDGGAANPPPRIDFSLGEAMRTYPFWIFNCALALPALIGTAATFHIVDLGRRAGLGAKEAVAVFPFMALFSISTSLGCGWLSDRIRITYLLGAMVAMQAVACAGLLDFGGTAGRWLTIVGFGVSGGLFALLMGVTWPRYFGRAHLGAISSVNMSVVVFASAVGPWSFAVSDDLTGDYHAALVVCAGLSLACLVAAFRVKNPQRLERAHGG